MKLASSLTHIFGPGQGMWRINSFSKSHVRSLPENLERPDSQRAQTGAGRHSGLRSHRRMSPAQDPILPEHPSRD